MSIKRKPKIDAPRAWGCNDKDTGLVPVAKFIKVGFFTVPVRIIRESDYRKLVRGK